MAKSNKKETKRGQTFGAVLREAYACLQSAEDLLCNYRADDTNGNRLERIERVAGLVDATKTVLRSLDGEGSANG